MKKVFINLLLMASLAGNAIAQGEGNVWRFGYGIGLDFGVPAGSPTLIRDPKATNINSIYNNENATSIANSAGKLLFYTSGSSNSNTSISLYNGNSELVSNLSSTNNSAAQGSIIIPKPGSLKDYFLFTIDAVINNGGTARGLQYYTVAAKSPDTVSVSTATKILNSPITESQAAAPHKNGVDYWLVNHGIGNTFTVIPVTSSGPGTPVISNVGPNIGTNEDIAFIKFNSCYTKLAFVNLNQSPVIFDFDYATGVISNPLTVSGVTNAYSLEFSNNGKYLYVSQTEVVNPGIFQYDIIAGTTKKLTGTFPTTINYGGQIQLGPDGNIYTTSLSGWNGYDNTNNSYIGQIANPDLSTAAWNPKFISIPAIDQNYNYKYIASMSLPTMLRSLVASKPEIKVGGQTTSSTSVCKGQILDIEAVHNGVSLTGINWNIDGVNQPNGSKVTYTFNKTGSVPVSVTVTDNCARQTTLNSTITVNEYITANASQSCGTGSPVLTGTGNTISGGTYKWFDKDPNIGGKLLAIGNTFSTANVSGQVYVLPTSVLSTTTITDTRTAESFGTASGNTTLTIPAGAQAKIDQFSISYYSLYNAISGTFTIELRDGSNNLVGTAVSKTVSHPVGSVNTSSTFTPTDWFVGAGTYTLNVTSVPSGASIGSLSTSSYTTNGFTFSGGRTIGIKLSSYSETNAPTCVSGSNINIYPCCLFSITSPSSDIICAGTSKTFTANTNNAIGNVSYQWQISTDGGSNWANVANGTPTGFAYSGSSTASLIINTGVTIPNTIPQYRVSATDLTCNKSGVVANLSLIPLPATPTTSSPITYCQNAVASNLTANTSNGNVLVWYGSNSTGGTASFTAPTPTTSSSGTTSYYVSQKMNIIPFCESSRKKIDVIVYEIPTVPVVSSPITYCENATASPLSATSTSNNVLQWYNSSTGGLASSVSPTPNTSVVGDTSYYVSQKISTNPFCESARAKIEVTVLDSLQCFTGLSLFENNTITIAPNPVKDLLYFNQIINGVIEIKDLNGKSILSKSVNSDILDLNSISSGMYLLSIQQEDRRTWMKIIKE